MREKYQSNCLRFDFTMLEERISLNLLCNFNDLQDDESFPLQTNWIKYLEACEFSDEFLVQEPSGDDITKAIAFLCAFIQENFTGPRIENQEVSVLEHILENISTTKDISEDLQVNGVELNPNVKFPKCLYIAKQILQKSLESFEDHFVLHWWNLRIICVHQMVLDELAQNLYEDFKKSATYLLEHSLKLRNKEFEALLHLEVANGFLLFHRTQKCDEVLEKTYNILEVELKVEGLLGVRTKFQQKPLPQLCLKVIQSKEFLPSAQATNGSTVLPKLLNHEDDTRLEKIKFLNEEDNLVLNIPSVLQALVFSKLKNVFRSQPKDRLADEELEPYTNTLLHQENGPLAVRIATLLFNIRQESNHKRTVERSLKQCEELLSLINDKDRFSVRERFSYLFASTLVPKWDVKKQLGDLMASLGMIKTALDLYLEIQQWDEVIDCYNHMELRHKAAQIIKQEIDKKPSVKLYCLLGDAIDDTSCYETAWKFSKETSGRAQRHWGNYYFAKKDYESALPHLQKTVEINALQEIQWLRLGYAAISLEKWELAVHAYLTYTHLEPTGFESWNNLAKALIKLGDKPRAHKILNESLKCNFNNWKVWENFMLVSVDTQNFEDVLNSYNRLIELKERYLDLQVLEMVIPAIAIDTPDSQGRSTKRLWKKASELLGHQCVQHGSEWKLWQLASLVAVTPLSKAQKLQKAFQMFTQRETNWATLEESSLKVICLCGDLCEMSLAAVENHDMAEGSLVTSQLSSARLSSQACIRAVENNFEKWDSTNEKLVELKDLHGKTTEELKKRL